MPQHFGVGSGGSSGFTGVSPSSLARGGDAGWHWVLWTISCTQQRGLTVLPSAASRQVFPHPTGICKYHLSQGSHEKQQQDGHSTERGNPLRWVSVSRQDEAAVSNILFSHPLPLFSHPVQGTNLHRSLVEIANCGYVKVSFHQMLLSMVLTRGQQTGCTWCPEILIKS